MANLLSAHPQQATLDTWSTVKQVADWAVFFLDRVFDQDPHAAPNKEAMPNGQH